MKQRKMRECYNYNIADYIAGDLNLSGLDRSTFCFAFLFFIAMSNVILALDFVFKMVLVPYGVYPVNLFSIY